MELVQVVVQLKNDVNTLQPEEYITAIKVRHGAADFQHCIIVIMQ